MIILDEQFLGCRLEIEIASDGKVGKCVFAHLFKVVGNDKSVAHSA